MMTLWLSKTLKLPQNFLNYVLQWYPTADQKTFCILFWKLDVKMKKKMASLNNSKNFTIIFDHQFNINEKQNWGTFKTILGFQTFFPHPARSFFLLFNIMTSSNLYCFCSIYVCLYIHIYILWYVVIIYI